MLGWHIPLADQVVELLHRAFANVMNLSASTTNVKTLVRGMSLTTALLTRQSLPTSTIVMLGLSTMATGLGLIGMIRSIPAIRHVIGGIFPIAIFFGASPSIGRLGHANTTLFVARFETT